MLCFLKGKRPAHRPVLVLFSSQLCLRSPFIWTHKTTGAQLLSNQSVLKIHNKNTTVFANVKNETYQLCMATRKNPRLLFEVSIYSWPICIFTLWETNQHSPNTSQRTILLCRKAISTTLARELSWGFQEFLKQGFGGNRPHTSPSKPLPGSEALFTRAAGLSSASSPPPRQVRNFTSSLTLDFEVFQKFQTKALEKCYLATLNWDEWNVLLITLQTSF